jgi:acetoin utilization protein AcuB
MTTKLVKDWMTSNTITVSSKSTLPDAYRLMLNNKLRRVPVMENDALVGMVTLGDLRRGDPPVGLDLDLFKTVDKLSKMTVHQVMSRDLHTVSPTESLVDAAHLMLKHSVRVLPVLDEEKLVGIISRSDILRAFIVFEGEN